MILQTAWHLWHLTPLTSARYRLRRAWRRLFPLPVRMGPMDPELQRLVTALEAGGSYSASPLVKGEALQVESLEATLRFVEYINPYDPYWITVPYWWRVLGRKTWRFVRYYVIGDFDEYWPWTNWLINRRFKKLERERCRVG